MSFLNQVLNFLKTPQEEVKLEPLSHMELMKMKHSRTVMRNTLAKEKMLRELVAQGFRFPEIRLKANMSASSLNKALEILQLEPNCLKPIPKHPLADKIAESLKEGLSMAEIGRMQGLSRERIRQIVVRDHPELINYRKPVEFDVEKLPIPTRRGFRLDRDMAEKIMALRKEGKTWNQVTESMKLKLDGALFRVKIQRSLDTVFTKAERKEFFPAFGEKHYKP